MKIETMEDVALALEAASLGGEPVSAMTVRVCADALRAMLARAVEPAKEDAGSEPASVEDEVDAAIAALGADVPPSLALSLAGWAAGRPIDDGLRDTLVTIARQRQLAEMVPRLADMVWAFDYGERKSLDREASVFMERVRVLLGDEQETP